MHKSDGEAIAAKAAAVERLQGSVRQLEETVHKEQAKVEREETARKKVEAAAAEARQAGDRAMHAKQAELQQAQLQFERSKDEAQRLGAALAGAVRYSDFAVSPSLSIARRLGSFITALPPTPVSQPARCRLFRRCIRRELVGRTLLFARWEVCVNTSGGWVCDGWWGWCVL